MSLPTSTRLGLQSLEAREVPAVLVSLVGSELRLVGDSAIDTADVSIRTYGTPSTADDVVRVVHNTSTGEGDTQFPLALVASVRAEMGGNNDLFDNKTHLPSVVYGGSGHDKLYGGSGSDKLYGETGNDRLYGRGGNDQLYASSGVNVLYGGDGTDFLGGGAGGATSDRFLLDSTADTVMNYSASADAKIEFKTSGVLIAPTAWTQDEVMKIDRILAALHEATGNPALLRTNGQDLDFRKMNSPLPQSGNEVWRAGEVIHVDASAFNLTSGGLAHRVLHAVGHAWDSETTNPTFGQFKSIGQWTEYANIPLILPNGNPNYDIINWRASLDGEWWYHVNGEHPPTTLAKHNPQEDFAETFALYFLDKMGQDSPFTTSTINTVPQRKAYMDDFVIDVG